MPDAVSIINAKTPQECARCFAIRREVFVGEQNVPLALEVDDIDATCDHYLLREEGKPMATARAYYEGHAAIIGRIAVRGSGRGRGMGLALVRHIIAEIKLANRAGSIELGAQVDAQGFYEKLGFAGYGELYEDAGIPHIHMRLTLDTET